MPQKKGPRVITASQLSALSDKLSLQCSPSCSPVGNCTLSGQHCKDQFDKILDFCNFQHLHMRAIRFIGIANKHLIQSVKRQNLSVQLGPLHQGFSTTECFSCCANTQIEVPEEKTTCAL